MRSSHVIGGRRNEIGYSRLQTTLNLIGDKLVEAVKRLPIIYLQCSTTQNKQNSYAKMKICLRKYHVTSFSDI